MPRVPASDYEKSQREEVPQSNFVKHVSDKDHPVNYLCPETRKIERTAKKAFAAYVGTYVPIDVGTRLERSTDDNYFRNLQHTTTGTKCSVSSVKVGLRQRACRLGDAEAHERFTCLSACLSVCLRRL